MLAARRLLERLCYPSLPIEMGKVCDFLGISLRYNDLGSMDGYFMLDSDDTNALIVVNDSRSIVRQRFSVAHELGHLMMKHGPAGFMGGLLLQDRRERWQEVHANRFASELLMPKVHLVELGRGLTPTKISRICHVSEEAARIRIEQLGWG